jgi:hypothetical protein
MKKLILLAMVLALFLVGCTNDNTSAISVGQNGILTRGSGTTSPVSTTKDIMDKFFKAYRINDTYEIGALVSSGQVFLVNHGTKVLVIDSGQYVLKVRILEGEHRGKAGWVPHEYVR